MLLSGSASPGPALELCSSRWHTVTRRPSAPDDVLEVVGCGPGPAAHVQAIRPFMEAEFTDICVVQVADDRSGLLSFCESELLPALT